MTEEKTGAWESYGIDQISVEQWVRTRMGDHVFESGVERATRLVEESIELLQYEMATAQGESNKRIVDGTKFIVGAIIDRVFSKPPGDPEQEAGGIIVCLLAWCALRQKRLDVLATQEIDRIYSIPRDHFTTKQQMKADNGTGLSPIPGLKDHAD